MEFRTEVEFTWYLYGTDLDRVYMCDSNKVILSSCRDLWAHVRANELHAWWISYTVYTSTTQQSCRREALKVNA